MKPLRESTSQTRSAFTLIELLVVIGIISLLTTLSLAAFKNLTHLREMQTTSSNMRTLGQAIALYIGEHDGYLPGPLWTGNFAYYGTGDTRTLGYQLWPYLGLPSPTTANREAAILTNPAYLRQRLSTTAQVYYCYDRISATNQATISSPWGKSDYSIQPTKWGNLSSYNPTLAPAITELDQKNYTSATACPNPPLGNVRMTLYFDWHVEPVPVQ